MQGGLYKQSRSHHVNVMVAKTLAMLGFIRRLTLMFRDPCTLMSLYTSLVHPKLKFRKLREGAGLWCSCWQSEMRAEVVYSICIAWFGLGGHACMICHHMRTDARPSASWHPYEKVSDCLCDVYFWCSKWESELTKLVACSRFDYTTISDSRYQVSEYWFPSNELWNSWINV
jgi:hypothetical protein